MDTNQKELLLGVLKKRFEKNKHRHEKLSWDLVVEKINQDPKAFTRILMMEESGGEPDIFDIDGKIYVIDASKESPKGRVSCCYDEEARLERKKFPPETSAEMLAKKMDIELIDETLYRVIQAFDDFDLKTSSWIKTPKTLRDLGGALFGDKRYERTFIYHNGADSYYGSRGFRGYFILN
ncbi:MAG: hypothetical protein A2Y45_04145 [Tenericutes bacterium GWC2_34_14]|nr:MAG: hypothetical protein A2Z84_08400 [Tenericutes bacterium GWA2_35_7]OHE28793.1 MAG: hypothetical protein A2Y45_04145 [Tenericutes bacterium GWC2_34_14]OHE33261.1 MAG: hypothetical protein A2012_05925 [Tenericutes bacterium GWE2_34_108]OHE36411.1 MAG: hypothetical protein A2Y46_08030 [Tenericutes bacterium GWF1_35_14]OHE37615.1 MAG: hypothetical protein A2Y44_02955 [Tenericutes bacterium GWF2_35_184]OHE41360.1 MAG: hypothetical protein A3K26_06410 [Tenericutes bacterium RIFOXYA12_FULL_35_